MGYQGGADVRAALGMVVVLIEDMDDWDVYFSRISSVIYGNVSEGRICISLDNVVALVA